LSLVGSVHAPLHAIDPDAQTEPPPPALLSEPPLLVLFPEPLLPTLVALGAENDPHEAMKALSKPARDTKNAEPICFISTCALVAGGSRARHHGASAKSSPRAAGGPIARRTRK
jgi:hypothetical protein